MAVDVRFRITAEDRAKFPADFLKDIATWQARQFYGSRIEALPVRLSAERAASFQAMSYARQCYIIGGLIRKGAMT